MSSQCPNLSFHSLAAVRELCGGGGRRRQRHLPVRRRGPLLGLLHAERARRPPEPALEQQESGHRGGWTRSADAFYYASFEPKVTGV